MLEDKDDYEESNEGIYDERFREELEESDEINEAEEWFMQGYEEEELIAECANCKKILNNNYTEEEINDKKYRFCSEICAEKFMRKFNK